MKRRLIWVLIALTGFSTACFSTRRPVEERSDTRTAPEEQQVQVGEDDSLPFVAMYGVRVAE